MTENEKASTALILEQRLTPIIGGSPVTGVWYSGFAIAKAEAEKTGRPLIAMWINPGCGFCERFCAAATSDAFRTWMQSSGAYFWLGSRTDGAAADDGREFVFQQSEADDIKPSQRHYFPGFAVWQCEAGHPDKVLHDFRASGRTFEQEKSGEEGILNIIQRIRKALTEPPYKVHVEKKPDAFQPQAQGGCPGGHPHLKALQEIAKIIAPFTPPAAAAATGLRIRMNPKLDLRDRNRRIQALLDNGGRCPCQHGGDATACLCTDFMRQDKPGLCRCGLYEKY